MNSIINYKSNQLFYAAIMTLILFSLATAQTRERLVNWPSQAPDGFSTAGDCGIMMPTQMKALEIVEIKVGDKPIVLGKSFPANEDWLKTLSVKVKNVSAKTISLIRLHFLLPEATNKDSGFGFSIGFREDPSHLYKDLQKVISPGEEVVLMRSDAQYNRDSKGTAQRSGKTDFSQVILGSTTVGFEDGKIWSSWKPPLLDQNASGDTKTTLAERVGHRISGTVMMKSDGQPIDKALVEIRSINDKATGRFPHMNCTLTDNQGRWSIDNVPDGQYQVIVGPDPRLSPINYKDGEMNGVTSPAVTEFVARTYEVKMAGTDITDLALEVARGGTITGKVIMEGGELLPKDLVVLPEQTTITERGPLRMAPVQKDGSFTLDGVPIGLIRLKVFVYGKYYEYHMKSATVNSIDLLRELLKIEDGSKVEGVRVIFAKTTEK